MTERAARLFGGGGATRGTVLWVLANPSVADEAVLDPTLTRCAGFSRAWGFSSMVVRNVLAYRATDPRAVVAAARDGIDVVGPENDAHLARREGIDLVVVGWGAFSLEAARAPRVVELLERGDLCCLGRNRDGGRLRRVERRGGRPEGRDGKQRLDVSRAVRQREGNCVAVTDAGTG